MQWLEVQPEDDEKTRAKKRKLAKSYKSKIRFQKMDTQQREKQSSWLNFQKGKGTKKKAGFFTGPAAGDVPGLNWTENRVQRAFSSPRSRDDNHVLV